MAWNGSDSVGSRVPSNRGRATSMTSQRKSGTVTTLRRPYRRGLLAGLIIVALGGAAVWWFIGRPRTPAPAAQNTKHKDQGIIAAVKPAITSNVVAKVETNPKVAIKEDPAKTRVKTLSFVTNKVGNIIERYQTADGKTHKVIRPSRPPIFTHATDDIIAMALTQNSSIAMPPLPISGDMDKEFLKSIEEPIVIDPDDSDDVKERKRIVREARTEIKRLMDQGMHFSEIMADHEKMFNENAEIRATAIAEAKQIRDEGDTEGISQYVNTMNAAFESMGIEKIEMPKTKDERRAEMAARRAAREAAKKQKGN